MARIVWAPSALADLEAACDYIANDAPAIAGDFAQRVILAVERVGDFPRSGRSVPEFDDASLREIIVGNYRILYEIDGAAVHVLAVHHGARLLQDRPRRRPT